jgi:outer membrane protein OmpA-like peptidoglycan-associated protein
MLPARGRKDVRRAGPSWSIALLAGLVLAAGPAFAEEPGAEGCVGKVRLRGPLWDTASGQPEPGLDAILDAVAETIRERCGERGVVIEAHAFELPAPELNQRLSELRAALVRHELVKRGVPARRLLPVGMGETAPLVPAGEPGAALENRRVTFRALE